MRFKAYILFCFVLFASGIALCQEGVIRSHIDFLCSDALEGRLTGSLGEKKATQYIADFFQQLQLAPAGDNGTYFQYFDFVTGVSLGNKNQLIITDKNNVSKQLELNQDWCPLAYSASQSFKHIELVFINDDDYHNLDVKNKWVVLPRHYIKHVKMSLRRRVLTAKKHGATGVIFVNNAEKELIHLKTDTLLFNPGIIVLSVKNSQLLKNATLTGQTEIYKNIREGRNVLAKLRGAADNHKMIVVGAHVDHLGRGQLGGSRGIKHDIGMIHRGADDNASGVASMLEAAKTLSQAKLTGNKDILFAAWSGEEFGILGSSYFVKHPTSNSSIVAAINLDMVGHLRKGLVLQGVGSSKDWPGIIKLLQVKDSIKLISQNDPYLPTDSTAFYLHNIPTLNLFTGAHENYHTPRDTPASLNYAGIDRITHFLVDLILMLQDNSRTIGYSKIQAENKLENREMKIYLGTIPDYAMSDIAGVKISGVANHSPAEQAGLRQDDVIIELAGKSIHDIYDYTFAINTLPVGKAVKLTVLREKVPVRLNIIARHRNP